MDTLTNSTNDSGLLAATMGQCLTKFTKICMIFGSLQREKLAQAQNSVNLRYSNFDCKALRIIFRGRKG